MSLPRIAMVDLAARHRSLAADVEARVLQVLRSGQYIGGDVVAQAEAEAARLTGRRYAVGVNSGTDALTFALLALGVRPGDEVIVPALTFFATAGSVCAVGAIPVIVDVREDALIDPDRVVEAVGPRTRAIVPVHLFGATAPDLGVDVPIVDDLAQAVGATPAGRGVLGAVSTYPTKTWGGAGDGGFVVGDDPEPLALVRQLSNHGTVGPHLHFAVEGVVGRNSRLDAVQAAVLLAQAERLPARLARRRALAARYDAGLPTGVRPLGHRPGDAVHQYVVALGDRDHVAARLDQAGISTAVYYPHPLHHQPALLGRARWSGCPVAEHLCDALLALPVHEGLSDEDVDRVLHALHAATA